MTLPTSDCPGCGLERPLSGLAYDRKFNASAECWAAFEAVIAAEFQNAALFGRAHQLTVDAYAVQHAGGRHPDKSVCVHLAGLCLALEQGVAPTDVPKRLQRVAGRMAPWPHFEVPAERSALTVGDVERVAGVVEEHAQQVRAWATDVWRCWREHHDAVRSLLAEAR